MSMSVLSLICLHRQSWPFLRARRPRPAAGCQRQRSQTNKEQWLHLHAEHQTPHHRGQRRWCRPLLCSFWFRLYKEIPQLEVDEAWWYACLTNLIGWSREVVFLTLILLTWFCADSSAQLQLTKKPLKEGTYSLQITVKDRAGMGIPNLFEGNLFV